MRAGELPQIASRTADHAQHLAIERHFENPPRESGFADEQHLSGTGRDAERIGRADHAGKRGPGWRSAIDSAARRIRRNVDREHPYKLAVGIEDLDAPVGAVADIDIVVAVNGYGVRKIELAGPGAFCAP